MAEHQQHPNHQSPHQPTEPAREHHSDADAVQELLADFRTQLLAEVQEVVTDAVRDALDARQHAPPLLTVEQVAERLNVSVRTVESLIADGELVPLRIRGARRFTDQTIDAFLRSCAGKKKRRRKRAT